jgi:hypothetical protein
MSSTARLGIEKLNVVSPSGESPTRTASAGTGLVAIQPKSPPMFTRTSSGDMVMFKRSASADGAEKHLPLPDVDKVVFKRTIVARHLAGPPALSA